MASSGVPPALRKKLETADRFFAAGDLRSAKMHADMAMAIFPGSPEAQRAHAAYRVLHAAGANANAGRGKTAVDHYAVLGVAAPLNGRRPTSRETQEAVKGKHKALTDTLDPANAKTGGTSSSSVVAAAAAYKLVNEAFAALMDVKKNEAAAAAAGPRRARLPPLLRPKVSAPAARMGGQELDEKMGREKHAAAAAAAAATMDPLFGEPLVEQKQQCAAAAVGAEYAEEDEEDYYAGGRIRGGRPIRAAKYY